MNPLRFRRLGLLAALASGLVPLLFAAEPAAKTPSYDGKVVLLAGVLEKLGAKLDRDVAEQWLALVTADGKVYPLVKDAGSRMFFLDPTLRNRPMRLTGRLLGDNHFLQVTQAHSLNKGELHDIYYWCDICAIKRFEKMNCDCCGAPMELRELPAKK